MLMVTNSFVVIILNSFLLLITEEVHEQRRYTSIRTISTCVMYYSKFEQEPSASVNRVVAYKNLKAKEKSRW